MLSISSGHSADYLLDAVATGRESYYTSAVAAGEPPGRWYGAGAESLGLVGEVNADVMRAVYGEFRDPRDPEGHRRLGNEPRNYPNAEDHLAKLLVKEPGATPERQEELAAEAARMVRNNIGFYDATFSPPKSVTVVHASFEAQEVAARNAGDLETAAMWAERRMRIENAIWAGNRAALDYLSTHAGYARIGHHSGSSGRWTDAHDWTVASFFQHDSRNHDPQLHIHNAVLNRVKTADGKWLAFSGQDLNLAKRGAGAVAERTMFEHLAAQSGLLSAMRPDGKSRELLGVDGRVMDHFSTRAQALTPRATELAREYEAQYGRAPNAVQMHRFKQQATLATRPAKEHTGETSAERLERWDRELRTELGCDLAAVAHKVLELAEEPPEPRPFSVEAARELALAEAQSARAHFTESALVAAFDNALPDYLGGLSGDEVQRLLRGIVEETLVADPVLDLKAEAPGAGSLPDEFKLTNGRSAFEQPGSRLYATAEHVRSERVVREAAVERGAVAMSPELAQFFTNELAELGIELGVDQRRAIEGVLTDGAKLSALVGAAGAGKSFAVGALVKAWQDPSLWGGVQHRAFGLAAAQVAAEVLAGEGLDARNVSAWLGVQQRLEDGHPVGDDTKWAMQAGDLVVVDESSMADTAALTQIRERVDAAGGKLLLTGDHRQLAAVGPGGGMGLVAGAGISYELAEVRRFTAGWEREASLRLREGDPSALGEYRKQGRIVGGGSAEETQQKATRAYLADVLAGRNSLLITDTNEQAGVLSAAVRADLVRLGRVAEDGVSVGRLGAVAGVGDVVSARRNAWDLAGFEGNRRGPINRERYTVTDVRGDGALVVDHVGERMVLPASYSKDLELGYASTVHSALGLTVDACSTVATSRTGPAALYVGLTRGRDNNTAYVETVSVPADSPPGAVHDAVRRDPVAVLAGTFETAVPDRAAVEELEASAVEMGSARTAGERFAVVAEIAAAGRTTAWLDELTDSGVLAEQQRRRLAADAGMSTLSRVLRQVEVAGHDPQQVLTDAVMSRSLDGAHSLASVLHDRISGSVSLEPAGDSHSKWVPNLADPNMTAHLRELAAVADKRRDELGAAVVVDQPQWAVEGLGAVPTEEHALAQWTRNAGIVAAHRERTGHDVEGDALPPPPRPGRVEEYASWRAGWRALGRPEVDRAEREMSDGQLRMRVRGMERELAWQPPYVARELSGTLQAEQLARQTTQIRRAEATAADNAAEREVLEQEARESAVEAEVLREQAKHLERADTVRALWYAHTAETRAADQRARLELSARGVDVDDPSNLVTARELLEAQSLGVEVDDLHRDIVDEAELVDVTAARNEDSGVFADRLLEGAVTAVPDIRDVAADEPRRSEMLGDWTQVPDVTEVADDVHFSKRALAELEEHRTELDQRADDHNRIDQVSDWDENVNEHQQEREWADTLA